MDFGVIQTIANEAAQGRKEEATEPPVANEEGPRSRYSLTRWTDHGAARSLTIHMDYEAARYPTRPTTRDEGLWRLADFWKYAIANEAARIE